MHRPISSSISIHSRCRIRNCSSEGCPPWQQQHALRVRAGWAMSFTIRRPTASRQQPQQQPRHNALRWRTPGGHSGRQCPGRQRRSSRHLRHNVRPRRPCRLRCKRKAACAYAVAGTEHGLAGRTACGLHAAQHVKVSPPVYMATPQHASCIQQKRCVFEGA